MINFRSNLLSYHILYLLFGITFLLIIIENLFPTYAFKGIGLTLYVIAFLSILYFYRFSYISFISLSFVDILFLLFTLLYCLRIYLSIDDGNEHYKSPYVFFIHYICYVFCPYFIFSRIDISGIHCDKLFIPVLFSAILFLSFVLLFYLGDMFHFDGRITNMPNRISQLVSAHRFSYELILIALLIFYLHMKNNKFFYLSFILIFISFYINTWGSSKGALISGLIVSSLYFFLNYLIPFNYTKFTKYCIFIILLALSVIVNNHSYTRLSIFVKEMTILFSTSTPSVPHVTYEPTTSTSIRIRTSTPSVPHVTYEATKQDLNLVDDSSTLINNAQATEPFSKPSLPISSSSIRIHGISRALDQFKENLLFGNSLHLMPNGYHPHNFFLEVAISTGLLGLIPFSILLIIIFRKSYVIFKYYPQYSLAPIVFLHGLINSSFSGSISTASTMFIGIGLILSISSKINYSSL